jgi:hypothetical protein
LGKLAGEILDVGRETGVTVDYRAAAARSDHAARASPSSGTHSGPRAPQWVHSTAVAHVPGSLKKRQLRSPQNGQGGVPSMSIFCIRKVYFYQHLDFDAYIELRNTLALSMLLSKIAWEAP